MWQYATTAPAPPMVDWYAYPFLDPDHHGCAGVARSLAARACRQPADVECRRQPGDPTT